MGLYYRCVKLDSENLANFWLFVNFAIFMAPKFPSIRLMSHAFQQLLKYIYIYIHRVVYSGVRVSYY